MSYSKWKKGLAWTLQRGTLERADCIHATAEEEYRDVRALGFKAPIAIVPNGVDLPSVEDCKPRRKEAPRKRILFLGRLHPIKGVPRLLKAWSRVERDFGEWDLLVAGFNEKNHLEELKELAERLGVQRVRFAGPVYGAEKEALFKEASLLVLPSHSENFGMVVAEALAHAVPVITTRGAPWRDLESRRCGWWVSNSEEGIEDGLREALSVPGESRREMGRRGREWMAEEFSWDSVAQKFLDTYRWLVSGGRPPSWVRIE